MWRLLTQAMSPKEGMIEDLIHETIHKEIIDFMYEFYKNKYPNEVFLIDFVEGDELPF